VLDLPCRKAYDLRDDFSASTLGVDWAVVDQSTGGVANWALGSGFAVETGNADRPPEFGTWLQPTVVSYGISRFRARLYAYDDDQIGLMYGIRSPADHQRIDLDVDGYRAQLLSTRADVSTTLAVQNAYTVPHRSWYSLQVDYDGVRQVVRVNDQVLFDVEAPECLVGGIGLFARQMSDARFDDVVLDGPARRCGDGALDPGEQCDDGNLLIGDGCDQLCAFSEEGARDHDGDGVTDFHEANVAGTDPYTP
jgi:cysteine-rich repeat protein